MPKVLVGIISAAFAFVIAFGCGALLTAPENIEMEKLVNEKTRIESELQAVNSTAP